MTDDEDNARRLARAICADVMLYNAAVKHAPVNERGGLIAEPISEGRALFASRVSPRLAGIFEAEVAQSVAGPLGLTATSISASQPTAPRPPALAAPVLLVGALAAFFFFRA